MLNFLHMLHSQLFLLLLPQLVFLLIIILLKPCCSQLNTFLFESVVFPIRYLSQSWKTFLFFFFLLLFQEFCEMGTAPPALILLLSRLCLDFQESTISYVVRAKPRSHDFNGFEVEWGGGTQRKPIGSWGKDDITKTSLSLCGRH